MRLVLMFSRRTQILLTLGLVGAGRAVAQLLGVDLLPGSGTETGLLLLWGIGHCDTLDGPVVKLARQALDAGNWNLVLPWVPKDGEPEIRRAFDHTLSARRNLLPTTWPPVASMSKPTCLASTTSRDYGKRRPSQRRAIFPSPPRTRTDRS